MIENLVFQHKPVVYLCSVCISDNNGGKIALLIIILSLIGLGIANWVWKKYFINKKEISNEK